MQDGQDVDAQGHDRTGVLLLNLGGPWTLDDVRPFLLNLFSDREIIPMPGGPALQGLWARLISSLRAPKVRKRYSEIGGGSPLLYWTRRQAAGLQQLLNHPSPHPADAPRAEVLRQMETRDPGVPDLRSEDSFVVAVGMRYSSPTSGDALSYLKNKGCRSVVVLPLFPQECRATTGSSFHDLEKSSPFILGEMELIRVRSFHDHPGYIGAVAAKIREALSEFPNNDRPTVTVLFSAHAIPYRMVQDGDPYVPQIEETVDRVVKELDGEIGPHRLTYQSRTGPVRWTGPGTVEVLEELGQKGVTNVLVVPVSFVSDHIETLHEIDIEFAEIAHRAGIANFRRVPCLNDSPAFLAALGDLVRGVVE
jgi:ferrochelatase